MNDYLWGRCKVEETAYDVTEAAIGAIAEDRGRARLFLIPSSLKTGAMAALGSHAIFVNRFPGHPFTQELHAVVNRLLN